MILGMTPQPVTDVILEIGKKRVFACAAAWPGWCRSGRSEELALETLAAYLPRYAPVARLGPRGGGRDTEQIVEHVTGAEASFARKIGVRHRRPDVGDEAAIAAMRPAITAALGQASDGTVPLPGGWPVRYAARRIAWHALDHAWEIEDKSEA